MSLLKEQINSTTLDQIRHYVFQDLQNLFGLSMDIQAMFDWLKDEADYDELKQVAMNKLITQVNLSNTLQNSIFEDYHQDQSLLEYLNNTKEQAKKITKELIEQTIINQLIQEQLRQYIDNNLSKIVTIKQQNIIPIKTKSGFTQNTVKQLVDSMHQVAMDLDSIKSNKSVNKFSTQELNNFCKQRYQNALAKVQQLYPKQMYQIQMGVICGRHNKEDPIKNELKFQDQLNQRNQPQNQYQIKKDDKKNEQEKQNQQRKEDTKIVEKQNQKEPKQNNNQQIEQKSQIQTKIYQEGSQKADNQNPKDILNQDSSQSQVKNTLIKNNQIYPQVSLLKEQQKQIQNQKLMDSELKIKNQQQQDQNPPQIQNMPNQLQQQTKDQNSDQSLLDQQEYFNNNQVDVDKDKLKQNSDQNKQQNTSQIYKQKQQSMISQISTKKRNLYSVVVQIYGYINNTFQWEQLIGFLREVKQNICQKPDENQELKIQMENLQIKIKEQQLQSLFKNINYYLFHENSSSKNININILTLPYKYEKEDQVLITDILNNNEF